MKAFVYLGQGQAGFRHAPRPQATGFDAIVRPRIVSPCTSDVHNVAIGAVAQGRILGHEGIGEIVEVGEQVTRFRPGDLVAIPASTPDWRALPSQQGVPQHCRGLLTGNSLSSSEDGLFAPFARIRDADANLTHLPPDIDPLAAVMAGDMVNTGCYGAELADIQMGDTVVVLGIGPVGLMAVAAAKLRGAGRIIAIGSRPRCIQAALNYGATDIVNYKEGDILRQVRTLTNKEGADCCICAGGDENALNQAVSMIRWGGTVGNVNYFATHADLPLNSVRWGFGMGNKTIRGGQCPGGRHRMDQMLALIRYRRLDPLPLITHTFHGLDSLPDAFCLMQEKPRELIKAVVYLD